jgi:hypothetical protein
MTSSPSIGMSSEVVAVDPKQRLIQSIRGWVHMENLAESLNHQATNARKLRAQHETDAIGLIKQLGLSKSTIQISGASLQLAARKEKGTLSWSYLEKEVPAWAAKSGIPAEKADGLLAWLQDHREAKDTEYLKKIV